jgi:hypothetical protein
MAYDLLFRRETESDFAIHPKGTEPATQPLPVEFSAVERKTLAQLEPSTRVFVINVLTWARGKGIPARLTSTAIYTAEESAKHYEEGRSGIAPGKLSWHSVGRAFHLAIPKLPPYGKEDLESYKRIGAYVRSQGGEWLGDKPIKTTKGIIYDTAHFEYHPGFDIATYRKMPLATTEMKSALQRRRLYG